MDSALIEHLEKTFAFREVFSGVVIPVV